MALQAYSLSSTGVRFVLAGVLIVAALVMSPAAVGAAVTFDSSSSADSGSSNVSSLSWSHTVASNTSGIVVVGVSLTGGDGATVTSATYCGNAMTLKGALSNSTSVRTEMWYYLAPATGACTVQIQINTSTGNKRIVGGAVSYTGVSQTGPFGTGASDTGFSQNATVDVTSAAGELVMAVVGKRDTAQAISVGSGQTQRYIDQTTSGTAADNVIGAGSTEPGAALVTMSWDWTASGNNKAWAIVGASLKPSGGGGGGGGSLTFDSSSSADSGSSNVSSLSWSHSVNSSTSGIVIAGVSINGGDGAAVTSATYCGNAMTLKSARSNSTSVRTEMWYRVAPPTGSCTVQIQISTSTGNRRIVGGAVSYTGVDQTTPFGTGADNSGFSQNASVDVSSATGDVVIAVIGKRDSAQAISVGSGQTQRYNDQSTASTTADNVIGASSTEAGAALVTMSWDWVTSGVNKAWAIVGASLKPSGSGGDGGLAFEGFGAVTDGGEGQAIVEVTTLNDSGAGSLREALSAGDRYITFTVGGEINLTDKVSVGGSNITIDGSTAPSPGITLKNKGLSISGSTRNDIIVRDIRIRDVTGSDDDGIAIQFGANRVILHRVSIDGSEDGNLDITREASDVTVQYSIISNNSKNSLNKYESQRITFHHNVFYGTHFRNPLFNYTDERASNLSPDTMGDIRNNVIMDWHDSGSGTGSGTLVECGAKVNIIKNFYSCGSTCDSAEKDNPIKLKPDCALRDTGTGNEGHLTYTLGNYSADGGTLASGNQSSPWTAATVQTDDACTSAQETKNNAGARPLDTLDQGILNAITVPSPPC